jgi:hypothetical protein
MRLAGEQGAAWPSFSCGGRHRHEGAGPTTCTPAWLLSTVDIGATCLLPAGITHLSRRAVQQGAACFSCRCRQATFCWPVGRDSDGNALLTVSCAHCN